MTQQPTDPGRDGAAEALGRWVAACNSRGHTGLLAGAVTADAVVLRFGWAEERGSVMETFEGIDRIAEFLARSPEGVRFAISATGPGLHRINAGWHVRYTMRVADFDGGGQWRVRLATDGRITHIEHQPDDLQESEP